MTINNIIASLGNLPIGSFWESYWFLGGAISIAVSTPFIICLRKFSRLKRANGTLRQQLEECSELLTYAKEKEQKAREEAEMLIKSKSLLLAKLSHEIRTPMNGVAGMVSLLTETHLNAEQREYAESIRYSAENLMTVINDILITNIIESTQEGPGNNELEHKDFDLRTVIEDVLEIYAEKTYQRGVELLYQIADNVPVQLIGDESRLKQVLMTLIENSIKYTIKGEICLGVYLINSSAGIDKIELGFEVKDTGIGMPEDKIKLLDRKISNLQNEEDAEGLELAITKRLIDKMGGRISLESSAGRGTVCRFSITVGTSLQPFRSNQLVDASLKGKKILVIDDNVTSLSILQKQLTLWKFITTTVASEKEVEGVLKDSKFDLIFIDHDMPFIDGIDLAKMIKNGHPKVPLILMKGQGDDTYKQFPGLFVSVIAKPIKQDVLYKSILKELNDQDYKIIGQQSMRQKLSKGFSAKFPLRILVAEDDKINQKIALKILNKLGYDVDLAKNGQEALEMVSGVNYDLIFMDVQMPLVDGLEATRTIRHCLGSQPVIIAMTANAMQGDRNLCLQAGMDDYISKPVRIDDLLQILEKWAMHVNNN